MSVPASAVTAAFRTSAPVRFTAVFALCVLCALGALHFRLSALNLLVTNRLPEDSTVVPTPRTSSLIALGHDEWAADVLWVRALVYFDEANAAGRSKWE